MLTPRFSLTQDAEYLYINIIAPFIKLADTECHVSDDEFYFYSQPYYLRLHLPGEVIENEHTQSTYDVDSGRLEIRLSKKTAGQNFEGLDMLTKLLIPKTTIGNSPEIDVLTSSNTDCDDLFDQEDQTNCEFDWYIDQKVNENLTSDILIAGPSYGFAHRKTNSLKDLVTNIPEMIDLKDPDAIPVSQRRNLREQQEKDKFDCEHYLADFFDEELIQSVISQSYAELTGLKNKETVLSEPENDILLQLPRREYIISNSELKEVYLGLVDLVFAYAYAFRFTQGELGIESDWIICKLSSTLSWLDSFDNMRDVLVACARRSLCFPLYRSWNLFLRVLSDVTMIFLQGKSQVLKCLLNIQRVLAESESKYPLNHLYVTDYCVWVQSADLNQIESLRKALAEAKISKEDLGLRLDELETEAVALMNGDEESDSQSEEKAEIDALANVLSDIVKVREDAAVDSDDDDDDDDSNVSSTGDKNSETENTSGEDTETKNTSGEDTETEDSETDSSETDSGSHQDLHCKTSKLEESGRNEPSDTQKE